MILLEILMCRFFRFMVALIQQDYVIMASNSSLSESSCVENYEAIIPCNIFGHIMFCFLSYRGRFLCCQTIIY